MTTTNSGPQKDPVRPDFQAAKLAGKQAVLGMPRWKFYLLIILAVVIGNMVEKWLISKYSLPEFKAFLLSFVAVILLGLLAGFALRSGARREDS